MDIRTKTANLIKNSYELPKQVTMAMFDDGLLTEEQCKKVLIRNEWLTASTKHKLTELKLSLADRYCVSFSTVEKYIKGI